MAKKARLDTIPPYSIVKRKRSENIMARTPEQQENLLTRIEKFLDDYESKKAEEKEVEKIPVVTKEEEPKPEPEPETEPETEPEPEPKQTSFYNWLFG